MCLFRNAADRGGAIFSYQSFGDFRVDHCIFRDNFAPSAARGTAALVRRHCALCVHQKLGGQQSARQRSRCVLFGPSTSPKIRNCIAWGNLPSAVGGFGTPDIAYSLIEGYVGGVANIDTDPMFVDSAANNFMLMENSPCIDAGDALVSSEGLLLDFAGQTEVLITPKCRTRAARSLSCAPTLGRLNSNTSLPPPPNPCPSDVNGSGTVDYEDLVNVLANWGPAPAEARRGFQYTSSLVLAPGRTKRLMRAASHSLGSIAAVSSSRIFRNCSVNPRWASSRKTPTCMPARPQA